MSKRFYALILLCLLLAACRQDADPTAPPAVTAVAAATTAAPPTATATEASTATLAPTVTLAEPGPTFTPIPTSTPAVTDTPEPTATPAPVFLLEAADFGLDRNRLTGELAADPSLLQRRPIAVKISNSPPEYVRPQSGLSQADIVFEHPTEGPITRFTAIIYGQTPPDMGPIRSARLIDLEIPRMFDTALAFSGASIGVSQQLYASTFWERLLSTAVDGYYRTGADKPYEHTLYADPSAWWEVLEEKDLNQPPDYDPFLTFSSEPPAGGLPAEQINIRYQSFADVQWDWDPESGRFWRAIDGEPHIDANNDEQISAANIVLVYAIHVLDQTICEYQTESGCQAFSTQIQIWGQGNAFIIRDGRQYEATWVRNDPEDMLVFLDEDGSQIPLQVGNTWFQIIPRHYFDPVTILPEED